MRTAVVAGLLAFVALAGCVSEEPVEHGPRKLASEDADPFNDRNSTLIAQPGPREDEQEGPVANEAPVALLSADVENGTVPFNVTFTLDGTDADGDALSWTFDADGDGVEEANGTVLPGEFTFSFTNAGEYTAVLNVTDGESSVVAAAPITASGAAEPNAWPDIVMTGQAAGAWTPVTGYTHVENPHEFTVPAGAPRMTITVAWEQPLVWDLDLDVLDPSGAEAASTAEYNDPVQGDGSTSEGVIIDAPAPGLWTAVVYEAAALGGDYTVTVSFGPAT